MSRLRTRLVLAGAAALAAVTVLTGPAGAAVTDEAATADAARAAVRIAQDAAAEAGVEARATTPAASIGSAVIREDGDFLRRSAQAGIFVIPLPPGTPAYDSAAGFSASFPVTGATGVLREYYGNVQLDGSLLAVNLRTGRAVVYRQLAFDIDSWQITGVPAGGTAPVGLLTPSGDSTVSVAGGVSSLTSAGLTVTTEGAQRLNQQLATDFFRADVKVGSFALSYTQG
ncbi:hypothetical protein ACIRBX_03860 [Kitasatospora sp. NPDC096147]|uniref:hypothetical protein n=1 Tax=Kitasatospora sp. NPDC096147 TaxID=3364093 RepID=UPI003804597F